MTLPFKMLKLCMAHQTCLSEQAALRVNNQEEGSDNLEKLPFLGFTVTASHAFYIYAQAVLPTKHSNGGKLPMGVRTR